MIVDVLQGVVMALAAAVAVFTLVDIVVLSPRRLPMPVDRLEATVQVWLDDERPAYETVEALERDVERVLRGEAHACPRLVRQRSYRDKID